VKALWNDLEFRAKTSAAISAGKRERWGDPVFRAEQTAILRAARKRDLEAGPLFGGNQSENARVAWSNEKYRQKELERRSSPEARAKQSTSIKNSPRYRAAMKLRFPNGRKRKQPKIKKWWSNKLLKRALMKARMADPEYRAMMQSAEMRKMRGEAIKAQHATDEFKTKQGASLRAAWADPVKRAAMLANRSEGLRAAWVKRKQRQQEEQ
jgi:hypothetical protein